jgi:hypothetical protein
MNQWTQVYCLTKKNRSRKSRETVSLRMLSNIKYNSKILFFLNMLDLLLPGANSMWIVLWMWVEISTGYHFRPDENWQQRFYPVCRCRWCAGPFIGPSSSLSSVRGLVIFRFLKRCISRKFQKSSTVPQCNDRSVCQIFCWSCVLKSIPF